MVGLTDDEFAAIDKAHDLLKARSAYDTEALLEIHEKRSGESRALYQHYRNVMESIGESDVSTLGNALEKIRLWRTEAEE